MDGIELIYDECMHALSPLAGWREWPAFRAWFARNLTPALNSWMGDVDVVYDGDEKLDPAQRYVFGYAPHGLFPIGGAPSTTLHTGCSCCNLQANPALPCKLALNICMRCPAALQDAGRMLVADCSPYMCAGAPYLPLLPQFRRLFPGVDPTPLVASVLFFAPIIRDFISWCGVRQVRNARHTSCSFFLSEV